MRRTLVDKGIITIDGDCVSLTKVQADKGGQTRTVNGNSADNQNPLKGVRFVPIRGPAK